LMHLYRFYSFFSVFNCQRTLQLNYELQITNCDLNWNRNP